MAFRAGPDVPANARLPADVCGDQQMWPWLAIFGPATPWDDPLFPQTVSLSPNYWHSFVDRAWRNTVDDCKHTAICESVFGGDICGNCGSNGVAMTGWQKWLRQTTLPKFTQRKWPLFSLVRRAVP